MSVLPYTHIAPYYDTIFNHIHHRPWLRFIKRICRRYTVKPKHILDLGCGTGTLTALMARKYSHIYAIDRSAEMLTIAQQKYHRRNITWECTSFNNLHYDIPIDMAVCINTSLNYCMTLNELRSVFAAVRKTMHPRGIFIFDMSTENNIVENFACREFHQTRNKYQTMWHGEYNTDTKIFTAHFTINTAHPATNGSDRFILHEKHPHRIFSKHEIISALSEKWHLIDAVGDFTFHPITVKTDLMFFIARPR